MPPQVKNTIANSLIGGIFLMMLAGIASWNVTAISDNTKAVQANTVMVYQNRVENEKQYTALGGLIVGLKYDTKLLEEHCNSNTENIKKCKSVVFKGIYNGN